MLSRATRGSSAVERISSGFRRQLAPNQQHNNAVCLVNIIVILVIITIISSAAAVCLDKWPTP